MSIEEEFELDNLLFVDRRCRICGQEKNLRNDFYKTRKDRGSNPSAYAYEWIEDVVYVVKRKICEMISIRLEKIEGLTHLPMLMSVNHVLYGE